MLIEYITTGAGEKWYQASQGGRVLGYGKTFTSAMIDGLRALGYGEGAYL